MKRFIEGIDRSQSTLFPERLEDYIAEDNPVRVIDVFVDALDLRGLGFESVDPSATGRPAYHSSVLLELYIYGYLNRVHGSGSFSTATMAEDYRLVALLKKVKDIKQYGFSGRTPH